MAAQEAGATANTTTGASYGAGGKFRKKPFRRQTTPYDRPTTALRVTNNDNNNSSFLRKLVLDPASKLISYGAERFFAPFNRKRIPPQPPLPQSPAEVNDDIGDGFQGAVPINQNGTQVPAGGECSQPPNTSSSSRISELEQLLKQKTFTRSEVNHLTELLQSRAVEVSIGTNVKKNEEAAPDFQGQQFARDSMEENRKEGIRSSGVMSTPVSKSKVIEDEIASPAELAKAYMGSRPSKVSPSLLGMRGQVGREDSGLLSNIPFASKSPMAFTMKTSASLAAPENGFITPRSRGRSAIYNMARTPYSKFQGNGVNSTGYLGSSVPSSSLSLVEHDERFGSKAMTLKRRSSVLDDEVGSIGPIRRIRQKSNLLSPRIRQSAHESRSDAKQKLQIIGEPRHNVSKHDVENENESVHSTRYAPVPSKSSEVAAKILQHLEKMSPKEKSSETKRSSLKLTPSMLSGHALRSMEDLGSSKLLLDVQDDHKLGDRYNAALPDTRDSTSQKQGKLEENRIKESAVRSVTWSPAMNNDSAVSFIAPGPSSRYADSTVSFNAPGPSSRYADSTVKNGSSQPPQKKRAFGMSAQEEDDVRFKELATRPLLESREPVEAPPISKIESQEEPKLVIQPETKSPSKTSELSSRDAFTVEEKSSTIGFQTSEQATAASESISVATFDRSKEANNPPPLFTFSSAVADKFPSLPLEPSSKTTESKLESSSSLVNFSTTFPQAGIPVLEKGAGLNPQKAGDVTGKYDAMSDGPNVSRPLVSSTASPSNDTNQISSGGALIFTSSLPAGTGTSTNSSGSIFGLAATPSISAGPVFKFGASIDPSPSVTAVSTVNVPEITKTKINPSSGSFHSTVAAFSAASSGNSTFGLGSSFSYSTPNNPQNSLDQSLVSAAGTVSQPTSAQSVSSTSLPSFNTNSTLSNSQVLNQQSSFGFSSSSSTSNTSAVLPSSAPTQSLFKFGASSSDGNAISPSSGANPGIFSFGLNSSSTNAVGSSSGSITPPLFSSGGSFSSSAFASVTNSVNPGMFNIGGGSSAASSAITSNSASSSIFGSTFTGFSFTASSTSSTPANAPPVLFTSSSSSLSSPFAFGATNSQPVFGNPTMTGFEASPGKSNQMNADDSMTEDPVQSFGQPLVPPTQAATPFMFSGQQNQVAPGNQSPFQASGSQEFSVGGGFSLGSGGGDRSGRKFVKVSRSKNRKK